MNPINSAFSILLLSFISLAYPATAESEGESQRMWPIELRCPENGNGVLKFVTKNKLCNEQRYLLQYSDRIPIFIRVVTYTNGADKKVILNSDLRRDNKTDAYNVGIKYMPYGENIYKQICLGLISTRDAYLLNLRRNKTVIDASCK
jgi:hypothetical protein